MKTRTCLSLVGVIFLISSLAFAQQANKAENLYQEALMQMEGRGNFSKALEMFGQVMKDFPGSRQTCARSQFQIGVCYEKLGRSEAQKAYERVIKDFADQREVVAEARTRLAALTSTTSKAEKPTMTVRRISTELSGPVSPDGKLMAYTTSDNDLGIYDLTSGSKRVLVKNDSTGRYPSNAVFSPDGNFIVYAALTQDWLFYDIYVIGIDGRNRRLVFQHNDTVVSAFPYDWAQDGRHLAAILYQKDGKNQVALINVENGLSRILRSLGSRYPMRMKFSSDDRYLAYDSPQSDDGLERDIFLLAADGSSEITIVKHPANDFLLGWSPDGKRILFASDRMRSIGVWMQEVTDGHAEGMPELIKSDMGYINSLGVTRIGSFFYSVLNQMADTYISTLDPTKGEVIVPPAVISPRFVGGNSAPDWSPDGKQIAFVRQQYAPVIQGGVATSSRVITIHSLETGEERTLSPKLKALGWYNLRWSPDGRSFVLRGLDAKNRMALHIIDAQTGALNLSWVVNAYWAEWSRDGKAVYYSMNSMENKQITRPIVVRDLETGKERTVYKGYAGISIALSPDGKQLAFSDFELDKPQEEGQYRASLKIIPASGGEVRILLTFNAPEDFGAIAWTADGNHIYFAKRNHSKDGKVELWRIATKGGEPQRIGLEMNVLTQITVHPDGRRIAYHAGKNKSDAWVMENFLSRFTVPLSKNPAK